MDEIDDVVDKLFGQYLAKKKYASAPLPHDPPPGAKPEPEIVPEKPVGRKPVIVKVETEEPFSGKAAPGKARAGKSAPRSEVVEIKAQTARMLRQLHKSVKSENWWHKLYYANKFLQTAMDISRILTRRSKP